MEVANFRTGQIFCKEVQKTPESKARKAPQFVEQNWLELYYIGVKW